LSLADIPANQGYVRSTPESGHPVQRVACALSARSGHRGSLDHLAGGREQRLRNGQAERFCGLEIDDQFDSRSPIGLLFCYWTQDFFRQ
jgi:hypothetical protein